MLRCAAQALKETGRQPLRGAMSAIHLYLESPQQPGAPLPPRNIKTDLLLFVKLYTPGGGPGRGPPRLAYVGHLLAHRNSKVQVRFLAAASSFCDGLPVPVCAAISLMRCHFSDALRFHLCAAVSLVRCCSLSYAAGSLMRCCFFVMRCCFADAALLLF
jgi:hypothetical protein